MQESHGEGLASHTGPESCVGPREGAGEALTGDVQAGYAAAKGPLRDADAMEGGGRQDLTRRSCETGRGPARSETPRMYGSTSCENRESPGSPVRDGGQAASGSLRADADDARAWAVGQPHSTGEVPEQTRGPGAEGTEGRGLAKGNPSQGTAPRTQGRVGASSGLARVREAAEQDKAARFTALLHHVYRPEALRAAYLALNREAAPGLDGETWGAYGEDLEANLADLSARLQRGAYRAKPVRRVFIPKAGGGQRPLGIPALEDKIVQRATAEVLSAVDEADFLGFSYGCRPGRGPHDALDALYVGLLTRKVDWVLDADIRGFYDAIDHGWLVKFV